MINNIKFRYGQLKQHDRTDVELMQYLNAKIALLQERSTKMKAIRLMNSRIHDRETIGNLLMVKVNDKNIDLEDKVIRFETDKISDVQFNRLQLQVLGVTQFMSQIVLKDEEMAELCLG